MNYQRELEKIIDNLDYKPKLLLHSCCGPCSSYVIDYLKDYFDITVYYYNPSIEPFCEYEKRRNEQIRYIEEIGNVKFIEGPWDNAEFRRLSVGLEDQREGLERCYKCYFQRLNGTALYAVENDFEYFCTTLTVSPHKNANKINEFGKKLEEKLDVKFLYSDFKKKDGFKKSVKLADEYNLYRQDYCGCLFSKNN